MYDSQHLLKRLSELGVEIKQLESRLGGNSKVYKFVHKNRNVILKVYLGNRRRIEVSKNRETKAYEFLFLNRFHKLPRIISDVDVSDGICLEYIEGTRPKLNKRTNQEIQESFLQLKKIFEVDKTFEDAIDATYSTQDILKQIGFRLGNLDNSLRKEKRLISDTLERLKLREPIEFPRNAQTYSFSDVGPHNMILRDGNYVFMDLEFFGRDSAVKMFLDYLLHPRNNISKTNKIDNLKFAEQHFGIELDLAINTAPFFAAKWATIVARRLELNLAGYDIAKLKKSLWEFIEIASLESKSGIYAKIISGR